MKRKPKDYLIAALDVPSVREALRLVRELAPHVGMFKVGSELYTVGGPLVVKKIQIMGGEVFLDLKYHDIPNTVQGASLAAAALEVKMFNVHCLGARKMLTYARTALDTLEPAKRPIILGVTVLTSHDYDEFVDMGLLPQVGGDFEKKQKLLRQLVLRLATIAKECQLNGIVASALEALEVRRMCGQNFLIVTPGIRPAPPEEDQGRLTKSDDQERVMTPFEAIKAGIDYMVVGRPIYGALDPVKAAKKIVKEIASAL